MGLILVLLFAASMNLLSLHFYLIFLAFFLFAIKPNRRFRYDTSVGLLVFFALAWGVFSPTAAESSVGIVRAFTYLLCYVMGVGLFDDRTEKNDESSPYKMFNVIIVTLALGTLAHYLLNWSINFDAVERETLDIWTGEEMAATGQAALACFPLAISISMLFTNQTKRVKIASVITLVVILLYNLVLAGRTLFLMVIILIAVALFHRMSIQKRGRMRLLAIVIAIILLLVFVYQANLFNIKDVVESSPLYDRFFADDSTKELDDDARMDRKLFYLANMDRSFFGGAHIREEVGYAHDVFLDTYDEAGIFALVTIAGYLLLSAKRFVACIKDKTLPFAFKNTVLCVYTIVYLEFMIEPVLIGTQWLFCIFCIMDGYVGRILSHNRMINSKVR